MMMRDGSASATIAASTRDGLAHGLAGGAACGSAPVAALSRRQASIAVEPPAAAPVREHLDEAHRLAVRADSDEVGDLAASQARPRMTWPALMIAEPSPWPRKT